LSNSLWFAMALSATSPMASWAGADVPVQVWEFNGADTEGWAPTGAHVQPLAVEDGALRISTVGGDPGIINQGIDFTPTARHWLQLRVRASETGNAQLFWFPRDQEGVGLATLHVPRAGQWVDLAVFPGWAQAGPLSALRLDVYHFYRGCSFEIDRIVLYESPAPKAPSGASSWVFEGDRANASWGDWRATEHTDAFMSPPLDPAGPTPGGWAQVRLGARRPCVLAVLWVDALSGKIGRQPFRVRGDGVVRPHFVQLSGDPTWSGRCARVGLEIPLLVQGDIRVESLALTVEPSGPPEVVVRYFGFEDAHNRAGRPRRLLAVIENIGGSPSPATSVTLKLPDAIALVGEDVATRNVPSLGPRDRTSFSWQVQAPTEGVHPVSIACPQAVEPLARVQLEFLPALAITPAPYVPSPRPVQTDPEVFMFYFPGWDSSARWAPIRSEAPQRKPLLGWYDEGNPECVDWQIKWARENGITGFILDWYWNQGQHSLDHWLKAYRKARYRDQLKLFLLWCNHKRDDVRRPEDIRGLMRYWLDEVFTLPGYHKIDGKPVVALFEPHGLRAALGGSEGVRQAFDICQDMAREAALPGIAFLSANNNYPPASAPILQAEGYYGATTYHEPGYDYHDCPSQQMRSYAKQVRTAPEKWRAALEAEPALPYFPVVDSGWDSRPWHAYRGAIVWGRSVELFEEWLRKGRDVCRERGIPMLVLGPANEWGEGSYLEPCTEFGFGMYEAVRRVLGQGDPSTWPANLGPEDVGRGPYDLEMDTGGVAWSFETGAEGWTAGSGCKAQARRGALHITCVNDDPTLYRAVDFRAETVRELVIRLRCSGGTDKANYAQLFWAAEGDAISGAAVVGFTFEDTEEVREYRIPLADHPRWRGRITQLRFDPACEAGLTVAVEDMRLE